MSDRVMSACEPPMGGIGFQPDRLASTSPAKVKDLAPHSVTACYANPNEILKSPKLSRQQKRELLCKWAFDAHRVEVTETGGIPPSRLDEVIDALIDLDVGNGVSVSKVLRKSPSETRDTAEAAA
jgi:hypothetical protein